LSFTLEIEPTGDIVEVQERQTLLDASLRQGVYLPHACNLYTCHMLVIMAYVVHVK